jgi:hypothetical protein
MITRNGSVMWLYESKMVLFVLYVHIKRQHENCRGSEMCVCLRRAYCYNIRNTNISRGNTGGTHKCATHKGAEGYWVKV